MTDLLTFIADLYDELFNHTNTIAFAGFYMSIPETQRVVSPRCYIRCSCKYTLIFELGLIIHEFDDAILQDSPRLQKKSSLEQEAFLLDNADIKVKDNYVVNAKAVFYLLVPWYHL